MTPPPSSSSPTLLLVVVTSLMTSLVTSQALDPETCYSRQHQSAIVNVRQAMTNPSTAMDARAVTSERDCVLSCCSDEVKPGAKCNMAVFNGNKPAGEDNCFLFHCEVEQDCPLMKAQDNINTYDIYKAETTVAVPQKKSQESAPSQKKNTNKKKKSSAGAQGDVEMGVIE